ncbi:MAG: CBS domain-containing protein, partial [Desulfurivibrionaceae bacterium]
GLPLAEAMTAKPKTITTELLAADALSIMQRHEITFLAVTDHSGKLAGVLHLQDLLGKGEFRFLV